VSFATECTLRSIAIQGIAALSSMRAIACCDQRDDAICPCLPRDNRCTHVQRAIDPAHDNALWQKYQWRNRRRVRAIDLCARTIPDHAIGHDSLRKIAQISAHENASSARNMAISALECRRRCDTSSPIARLDARGAEPSTMKLFQCYCLCS
jgi:hypothetical protein